MLPPRERIPRTHRVVFIAQLAPVRVEVFGVFLVQVVGRQVRAAPEPTDSPHREAANVSLEPGPQRSLTVYSVGEGTRREALGSTRQNKSFQRRER